MLAEVPSEVQFLLAKVEEIDQDSQEEHLDDLSPRFSPNSTPLFRFQKFKKSIDDLVNHSSNPDALEDTRVRALFPQEVRPSRKQHPSPKITQSSFKGHFCEGFFCTGL